MFGEKLKLLRESDNISQTRLAKEIGFSQSAIAAWENETREPGLKTLLKIAQYFNVSTDYLLGNSDSYKRKTLIEAQATIQPEDQKVLKDYKSLPHAEQEQVSEYVRFLAERHRNKRV